MRKGALIKVGSRTLLYLYVSACSVYCCVLYCTNPERKSLRDQLPTARRHDAVTRIKIHRILAAECIKNDLRKENNWFVEVARHFHTMLNLAALAAVGLLCLVSFSFSTSALASTGASALSSLMYGGDTKKVS